MKRYKYWDAEEYSQNAQFQYLTGTEFLAQHVFNGDEQVLDLGCGHGHITHYITQQLPRGYVLGIDVMPGMIAYAQRHYKTEHNDYLVMSADCFAFARKFDVIISTSCLHWVKDKAAAFRCIAAAAKANAYILLHMSSYTMEMWQIYLDVKNEEPFVSYLNVGQDPAQNGCDQAYPDYAKAAGLVDIDYQVICQTYYCANKEIFFNFLKSIVSNIHLLPTEALKDQFINTMIDRHLQQMPLSADGQVPFAFYFYNLKARAAP
jgi:trans-aconitate methyltransferase